MSTLTAEEIEKLKAQGKFHRVGSGVGGVIKLRKKLSRGERPPRPRTLNKCKEHNVTLPPRCTQDQAVALLRKALSDQSLAKTEKLKLRAPDFRAFLEKGANPKKHFQSLMTRYGVRGYRIGMKAVEGVFADFLFVLTQPKIAVFIRDEELTPEELRDLDEIGGFLVIEAGAELGASWFDAIAAIKGVELKDLSPQNGFIFPRVRDLEREIIGAARLAK